MKKSRIIIPALAMIAFSMAASITGAVAWFTAQRTATVNAGTYAVVKTTSDLEVTLGTGVGTSVSNNTVTVNGKLTDGSFDHKNKYIYTPNESGTGIAAGSKGKISLTDSNLSTLLERGTTGSGTAAVKVYTAITFDLTFTVTFGAANNDVALLMDNTADHTNFVTSDESTAKTAKGFRMAFVSNTVGTGEAAANNGKTKVLADLQESSHCHYINSESAVLASTEPFGGVNYVAADLDLIDSAYNTALPTSAQAKTAYEARADYMGYFDHTKQDANSKVSLNFTVVCWYEGTDPEIVNRAAADFQSVVATLHFEAKDIA